MTSSISSAEVESLRTHLGYGAIGIGASTYSPDGFKELFNDVVAAYLTGDTETTATTAITAGIATSVTPVSMTGIVPYAKLVIDVGDDVELVTVKTVTVTAFTAKFAKSHPATGYPVALMGGHARLRLMLNQADTAWQALQDASVGATAGLKQVDKGDVEWHRGFQVLKGRRAHYRAIQAGLSRLVRVPIQGDDASASSALESY